jgi:hypothetical protein
VNAQARTPSQLGVSVDVLLSEFRVAAGEIMTRSQAQHVLLNISIVGGGATAAYVLAVHDRAIFALVLSFFDSFLGAIWLDHACVITSKGIYISSNLWPQLRERLGDSALTSHEDWTRRQGANRRSWLAFVIPVMGVFVLPAVAGLVYSLPHVTGTGIWVAWALGAAITALSITYWVAYYLNHTVLTYIGPPYRPIRIPPLASASAHKRKAAT